MRKENLFLGIAFTAAAVICLVLFPIGNGFAGDLPAPFDNAKRLAMMDPEPNDGTYLWKVQDPDDEAVLYALGYETKTDRTGVVQLDMNTGEMVYLYHEGGKFFCEQYIITPFGLMMMGERQEVEQEVAIAMAFDFYRELVRKNLLPTLI